MRKPMTGVAESLALRQLSELVASGYDAKTVIEHAIVRGWQGLYPPKDDPPARPMDPGKQARADVNAALSARLARKPMFDPMTVEAE